MTPYEMAVNLYGGSSGTPARSIEDVEAYMVYWYVRLSKYPQRIGSVAWRWHKDLGPARDAGDNSIWLQWRSREIEAGRLTVQEIPGCTNGDMEHMFTDKWLEDMAPMIMKFQLMEAK